MNTFIFILLIGAIASIVVGVGTSILALLPPRTKAEGQNQYSPIYWAYAVWTLMLSIFLLLAPDAWYGPTWHYFADLPHGGDGMGYCLSVLSVLLLAALWRHANDNILSILLFLIGFVYWMSGVLFFAEGILGHLGLMEAPFMCYVGGQAFAHSAALRVRYRIGREK